MVQDGGVPEMEGEPGYRYESSRYEVENLFEVVGIDRSKEYVFEAGQSARAEGLRARFIAMDVRDLPFRDHFDLAISMWTSFGFFDEEANASIIAGIRRSLVPGGKFFIELINRDWLVRNFEPRSWSRIDESLILLEERVFEMRTSVNRCTWYFLEGGQVKETPIELRVYSFHEIVALLRRCGFWRIEGFGDLEGSPVSFDSRMMRVIATAR